MSTYLIKAVIYDPYPKEFETREKAVKIETAIARGIRRFRTKELKRKKVKDITIKVTRI